jgi:HEAT repeat protein
MKTVNERVISLEKLKKVSNIKLKQGLVKALKDKSPTVRGFAVETIGQQGFNELLKHILPFLEDPNSEVRMLTIEAISKLADGETYLDKVISCLRDKDELVRVTAAENLGKMANAKALHHLELSLNDSSELVRSYAAASIGSIGQSNSIKILEEYLSNEVDNRSKIGFYTGLYNLGEKKYLTKLIGLINCADYKVRCAVANTLSNLDMSSLEISEAINALKQALNKEPTVATKSSIENSLIHLSS